MFRVAGLSFPAYFRFLWGWYNILLCGMVVLMFLVWVLDCGFGDLGCWCWFGGGVGF